MKNQEFNQYEKAHLQNRQAKLDRANKIKRDKKSNKVVNRLK